MPISKKDEAKVRLGNKRVLAWKEYVKTPAYNPVNKDGTPKQVRLRGIHWGGTIRPEEVIDREQAIRSGGIVPDVSMRSADGKFARQVRSIGQIRQGHDDSVQYVGQHVRYVRKTRILTEEESPGNGGLEVPYTVLVAEDSMGFAHDHVFAQKEKAFAKPRPDSPFKRAGRSPFTVVIKKK